MAKADKEKNGETTTTYNKTTVTIDGVTTTTDAVSATVTVPNVTTSGSTAKPPKSYVVKIGQVMVGKGDLRKPGDKIAASELSPAQAKAFLADGTIAV